MNWSENKTLRQLLLVAGALAIGGVVAGALVLTRSEPPREKALQLSPMVNVVQVHREDVTVIISGFGTVQSTVHAQVVPEVGGRVISIHKNMFNGGFVAAGQPLIQIDPADHELAVEETYSQLEQARASLESMESRVAEATIYLEDMARDLERIQELHGKGVVSQHDADKSRTARQLAEFRVQTERSELMNAKSRLQAAHVAVRKAELNLSRTRISMPFNSVVLQENVDVGQYVVPSQSIAEVYGISSLEVPVPLEDYQLKWLPTVPIAGAHSRILDAELPQAEITTRFAGQDRRWVGRVVRTEGQVDPKSRMVDVVVRVENPMHGLFSDRPPLLPGTFVGVTIQGSILHDVIAVPSYAVHNRNEVWIEHQGLLQIRKIQIAYRQREHVYVVTGLEAGDQVIVSSMDLVTEGMRIRLADEFSPAAFKTPGASSSSSSTGASEIHSQ